MEKNKLLKSIYKKAYYNTFKSVKTNSSYPICIIVCGQPGAGKTRLVQYTMKQLHNANHNAIILDMDAYRNLIYKVFGQSNLTIDDIEVKEISKTIMENFSKIAMIKKCNIVVETTLEKPYTLYLAQKHNYHIFLRLISVSRIESLLSIFERYINNNSKYKFLTSIENHDRKYNKIINRINRLANKGFHIEIYERGNKFSNPKKLNIDNNKVIYFILHSRFNSFNKCFPSLKQRLENINCYFKNNQNESKDKFEELYKLNQIIYKIIN